MPRRWPKSRRLEREEAIKSGHEREVKEETVKRGNVHTQKLLTTIEDFFTKNKVVSNSHELAPPNTNHKLTCRKPKKEGVA